MTLLRTLTVFQGGVETVVRRAKWTPADMIPPPGRDAVLVHLPRVHGAPQHEVGGVRVHPGVDALVGAGHDAAALLDGRVEAPVVARPVAVLPQQADPARHEEVPARGPFGGSPPGGGGKLAFKMDETCTFKPFQPNPGKRMGYAKYAQNMRCRRGLKLQMSLTERIHHMPSTPTIWTTTIPISAL